MHNSTICVFFLILARTYFVMQRAYTKISLKHKVAINIHLNFMSTFVAMSIVQVMVTIIYIL